jgi:hypothetical protein
MRGLAMSARTTREVLEGYLECKYKGRRRLAGEQGNESDYQKMISGDEVLARTRAFAHLLSCYAGGQTCRGAIFTAEDLGRGTPLLLDVTVEHEQVTLRCDGLVRIDGSSQLGDFH